MNLKHSAESGCTLHYTDPMRGSGGAFWQHRDMDGRPVGPQYKSKDEALADTEDYVRRAGWVKEAY